MNKKLIKIFSVLLMIIMLISISLTVFAADDSTFTPSSLRGSDSVAGSGTIQSVGGSIIGILQTVGIVLSVVILIILGIKYMMGSAEEKAEYKKTMIPYIIGAALIFAASAFAQIIYEFFNGITLK